jgi:hypothetical protein
MKKFSYVYENTFKTLDMKKEYLYDGEKILNKCEEIKYEDE